MKALPPPMVLPEGSKLTERSQSPQEAAKCTPALLSRHTARPLQPLLQLLGQKEVLCSSAQLH